jgi:hypothetical protein
MRADGEGVKAAKNSQIAQACAAPAGQRLNDPDYRVRRGVFQLCAAALAISAKSALRAFLPLKRLIVTNKIGYL